MSVLAVPRSIARSREIMLWSQSSTAEGNYIKGAGGGKESGGLSPHAPPVMPRVDGALARRDFRIPFVRMSNPDAVPPAQPPCASCGYLADTSAGPVNFCPKCGMDLRGGAVTQAIASPLVGSVIADRYKLLSLLGEGGMGAVYKAEHVRMGKALALKLLRGDFARD